MIVSRRTAVDDSPADIGAISGGFSVFARKQEKMVASRIATNRNVVDLETHAENAIADHARRNGQRSFWRLARTAICRIGITAVGFAVVLYLMAITVIALAGLVLLAVIASPLALVYQPIGRFEDGICLDCGEPFLDCQCVSGDA